MIIMTINDDNDDVDSDDDDDTDHGEFIRIKYSLHAVHLLQQLSLSVAISDCCFIDGQFS